MNSIRSSLTMIGVILVVVIIGALSIYAYYIKTKLEVVSKERDLCTIKVAEEQLNNSNLKTTIDDLNAKANAKAIDIAKRIEEFNAEQAKLINLSKELRIGSNACEDIKLKLDKVKGRDYAKDIK